MVCFYCKCNSNKSDFETTKCYFTFNKKLEYVATIEASKEMIWLRRFMEELGKKRENSRMYSDIQSAIHLAKNSSFHLKTKNIHLKYHFI